MKATVRAILFDPEARDMNALASTTFGKLREPVMRVTSWARAVGATSASGLYRIGNLDAQLFQTPMAAPTVFNYYRPGFVPPNTDIAMQNLVAPEFQITHEVSVANYTNFAQTAVSNGVGFNTMGRPDVRSDYPGLVAVADAADSLVDALNLALTYNTLGATNRTAIRDAVNTLAIPAPVYAGSGSSTTVTYQGKTYTKCADEGGTCTLTGGARPVIYGANNMYAAKTATASIGCNNTEFGDPAVGTAKACYVESGIATAAPSGPPTNQAAIDAAKLNRVRLAIFMTMMTPEFLVQK
jgi:hypothetical protein